MKKLKQLILNWIESNPDLKVYSPSKNEKWEIIDINQAAYYEIANLTENAMQNKEEFKIFYENLDLGLPLVKWQMKSLSLDKRTENEHYKQFFNYIYNNLNEQEQQQLLSMGPRLISTEHILSILKTDRAMLKNYALCQPSSFAGLLNNEDFKKVLDLLKQEYKKQDYEDLLFIFLSNRKKQLSRIECQATAQRAIKGFDNAKRFEPFFLKMKEKSFLVETGKVISFNLNKNALYTYLSNQANILSKYEVYNFLFSFCNYINKNQKKPLFLNKVHVLNHEVVSLDYTMVFDCIQNNPVIDYKDLFIKVIGDASHGINGGDRNLIFKSAIQKYILEQSLGSEKAKNPKKLNKI